LKLISANIKKILNGFGRFVIAEIEWNADEDLCSKHQAEKGFFNL